MGTSDGAILGVTKIVDHGANALRWNLVILGDGYRSAEISQYHDDVRAFVNALYRTPPFDRLWCGINVHRVDVTSTDSGADDPGTCGDGSTGSAATPRTYFDATFCSDGNARRLLTVNDGTALSVAQAQVPAVDMTMVIVNTAQYGGSGGAVATFSLAPNAAEIGIHEMGHTAFGLADEYEYYLGCGVDTDRNTYAGGEPTEPNVTIDTNRATIKWGDLVAPTTAMPTTQNTNCAVCDPQANPLAAGTTGAFEGARYYHCGCYRPAFDCRMRALGNPFCPVCERVIVNALTPFLQTTSVTLATPSIAFANIPEGVGGTGVTTYRAAVLDVTNCEPITLRVVSLTANPTGSFGNPLGTVVTVPPGQWTSTTQGRLWVSYTSTTAGASAVGSLTVRCDETGQEWVIPIVANTVARPKSAVALVLDHSYSMTEDAGDGTTKVQKLREAAGILVSVMQQGDGLGIVRFDDTSEILMPITDVGPPIIGGGRATAQGIIAGPQLDPDGNTSIGAGVQNGRAILDGAQVAAVPPYDVTAMVVLTDGNENVAPFLSTVGGSITANTFAVGLGVPANVSAVALTTLTQGHNGYLLVTGVLAADQSTRLAKYFLQILAGITNANVVLDPQGYLVHGAEQRVPFTVTEADMGLDVILLAPYPSAVEFTLETPGGVRLTPAMASTTLQYVAADRVGYYRLGLPGLPTDPTGSHAGTWNAVLGLRRGGQVAVTHLVDGAATVGTYGNVAAGLRALPYNLLVHAYSNLDFRADLSQSSFAPGATVALSARLAEFETPVEGRAIVHAEVTRPDGSVFSLGLVETSSGHFAGSWIADQSGLYTARVLARGETLRATPFTRERTLTAFVTPGGDRPQEPGADERPGGESKGELGWCDLLRCLLESDAISDRLRRDLRERGLDLDALLKCLWGHCQGGGRSDERQRAATPPAQPTGGDLVKILAQPGLRALLRDLLRASEDRGEYFASLPAPARPAVPTDLPREPEQERTEQEQHDDETGA